MTDALPDALPVTFPVVEHAEIRVLPGRESDFEAAFVTGHAALSQAAGYRWARLLRQAEDPATYLLLVGWDSLEAHTVDFRGSALFAQWRGAVGAFFDGPPTVVHYRADAVGGDEVPVAV